MKDESFLTKKKDKGRGKCPLFIHCSRRMSLFIFSSAARTEDQKQEGRKGLDLKISSDAKYRGLFVTQATRGIIVFVLNKQALQLI